MRNCFLSMVSAIAIMLFSSSASAALVTYYFQYDETGVGTGILSGSITLEESSVNNLVFSFSGVSSVTLNASGTSSDGTFNDFTSVAFNGFDLSSGGSVNLAEQDPLVHDFNLVGGTWEAVEENLIGPISGSLEIYALSYLSTTEISTVPVPAAAWLFGSGLLGLIGIARRKKA